MNGRLYDPKLHRFLQPDNFVQNPYNTQNYNRYGYVLNNPLKWVDLNGEEFRNPDGTTYNGSNGEGLSVTQQTFIGSAISTLVQNWDEWKIKQFFNKNVSDGVKDGVRFLKRNINSFFNDIKGLFSGGSRNRETKVKVYSVVQADQVQAVGGGWQNNGFQSSGNNYGFHNITDPPVKMKPASAYNYSQEVIPGKFTDDWNYILNGDGGNPFSRAGDIFARDWGMASTGGKVELVLSATPLRVIRIGKYSVEANVLHRTIKPLILKATPKTFIKVVGKNPDIIVKGEYIYLTGAKSSPFYGKSYDTGLKAIDYFKK